MTRFDRFLILFLGLLLFLGARCFADKIRLADDGATDYIITLPEEASAVQKTAASELAAFLNQITGAEFPVLTESAETISPDVKQLAIGPSKTTDLLLKAAGEEGERIDYAYDAVRIARSGDSIVLSGHSVRGMLYAVYTFLENDLGCRWWTATESTIPSDRAPEIEVTPVDYAPKIRYRESFYTGYNSADCGLFSAKMKCNGSANKVPDEYGGHLQFLFFVHSFYELIPPGKYFMDHQDWFPEIDGVRKIGRYDWDGGPGSFDELAKNLPPEQLQERETQLCLTNEGLFQEMLKNVLDAIAKNPKTEVISVSQNDSLGFCTCEKCRAIDEEEGTHAGTLLRFVNRIAEEVEKVYPDVYVETLAYRYTRKPPLHTHARHNVIVRLCSIECSFIEPLATGEQNQPFAEDLRGWYEKAPNIFIWDYVTNFTNYLLPFPNYRVIKDNINFFVDHNTIGMLEQGNYNLPTGDFVQMISWVIAKLLWDPSQDQRSLMEEFIAGYYAPQLVPVYMEYFDTLSDACEKSGVHLGIYRTNVIDWLDYDSLAKATRPQDRALEIADTLTAENPEKYASLREKVLRERIPLDLVWAINPVYYRKAAKIQGKEYVGPSDPLQAAEDMFARYEKYGLLKYRENGGEKEYNRYKGELLAKCRVTEPSPIPDCLKDVPPTHLMEIADDEFDFYRPGERVFIEDDPAASNGIAARMPGNYKEWALSVTQWDPFALMKEVKGSAPRVRLYLSARADAEADDGPGLTVSVFDKEEGKSLFERTVSLEEIKGTDYKLLDLGSFQPSDHCYFRTRPTNREDVSNVWVDRLFFVWE